MVTTDDINEMLRTVWPNVRTPCVEVGPTHALASITPEDRDLRPGNFIAGPTQFGVADAALWFMVQGALGRVEPMALTSELSMRFLRPAVGKTLYARASLERAGKRSVVGTIRVWTDDNEDKPCATAQGTYMLPSEPTAAP